MGITEPFEFANRYLFESFSFFLFNPIMKLSVMLLGLRLLLAHSATMQEENDKARNANRQNEDAQDNIVENEITMIDEQHEAKDAKDPTEAQETHRVTSNVFDVKAQKKNPLPSKVFQGMPTTPCHYPFSLDYLSWLLQYELS